MVCVPTPARFGKKELNETPAPLYDPPAGLAESGIPPALRHSLSGMDVKVMAGGGITVTEYDPFNVQLAEVVATTLKTELCTVASTVVVDDELPLFQV